MKKDPKRLAEQIMELVTELAGLAGVNLQPDGKKQFGEHRKVKTSGATGGLRLLVQDGFFDEPRKLSEVRAQLKKEGRHYSNPTISMGLLSLVRERVLIRLQEKGEKIWSYVVRR